MLRFRDENRTPHRHRQRSQPARPLGDEGMNKECLWSASEVDALKQAYSVGHERPVKLTELAKTLGRNRHNVCRKARSLGLTNKARRKVEERKPTRMFASPEEVRAHISARMKAHIAANGHPRGALGMKHTEETRAVLSERSKAMWRNPESKINSQESAQKRSDLMLRRIVDGKMNTGGYSRTRGGKRDDLGGLYFRSAWEANYARYLNFLVSKGEIVGWAFEPRTFEFEKIKRGTRAYTPDFRVDLVGGGHEWHEVKGWMDEKSKTRLARFARYFPAEKLIVIDQAWFKSASKTIARMLPNWEGGTVHAPK